MKKKISFSIVTLLILILVLNHNEKPVQQHLLSQPEENPYQSLHTMLNNEDFYQRLIELPKVENAEIEIKKMLENDTDEIEKKEYSSDIFPASLVDKLQEILYYFCVNTESTEYCDIELLNELTSEQYELSKEESLAIFQEEAEYYDGIFRFFFR